MEKEMMMAEQKHIIEPERMGLWVAVTFILSLLALVVGLVSIKRVAVTTAATQLEVALLNKKIESLGKAAAVQAPAEKKAEVILPAGGGQAK